MFKSPVATWPEGLYLNGYLWEELNFEVTTTEGLQSTFMIKDLGCNEWCVGISNDRNRLIFEIRWNPRSSIFMV